MEQQPGSDTLVEDKFDVLVAAEAEHHHEGPGFAHLPSLWVEHAPGRAKIDLRLLARRSFETAIRLWLFGLQLAHKASDRRIAASVAAFLETLPNSHHLGAQRAQF